MISLILLEGVTMEFRLAREEAESLKELFVKKREKPRAFRALDQVSFSVGEGEVLGLAGTNGAGKAHC